VEKLNADAKRQQQQEIKRIVHEQAAAILRHRLVSSVSAESAKTYMETSTHGLVARTVVIDVTKPRARQSGVKSPTLKTEHVVSMQTCLCVC
jgi:methyl coenzyme M reductase alpha subunit